MISQYWPWLWNCHFAITHDQAQFAPGLPLLSGGLDHGGARSGLIMASSSQPTTLVGSVVTINLVLQK